MFAEDQSDDDFDSKEVSLSAGQDSFDSDFEESDDVESQDAKGSK